MVLSPQSQSVYHILLNHRGALSARELGTRLKIAPATVYRLTEPLLEIGLITRAGKYPYEFRAKSVHEGLSLFLLSQNVWFSKEFGSSGKNKSPNHETETKKGVEFSFVQSRDELMKESAHEIIKAKKSIDLLRSGHELTPDVMLAITEANKRNVVTRMLIQDYSKENKDQVFFWQQNGILVRKTPLRHMRLMIYDASTLYFMSYKHADSSKDLGLKISYPPFAVILSQLFEQWWKDAEKI